MDSTEPLLLTFDPQTVDHLGAKMYSHLPNAVAELIANAYDADATTARVLIGIDGTLTVEDNGHGMSREDVADKYLHIGRNRRNDTGSRYTESGRRSVSGKKGLGKLALFGIGKDVQLVTTRIGSGSATIIELSYDAMKAARGSYAPDESQISVDPETHGTRVTLRSLKRKSAIVPSELASSLAKLFNYSDSEFHVTVETTDGEVIPVDAKLRLDAVDVEFSWSFPESWLEDDEFERVSGITGRIVSSKTPLRQGMRGVTLYVNGRLANEPEYFGSSESSYAFSYLSGYLEVDYLDAIDPDVIATDRRAIDWEAPETIELRRHLQKLMLRISLEWRRQRNAARKQEQEEDLGVTATNWITSIRAAEQEPVRELIVALTSDDIDMSSTQQISLLGLVKRVAPPFAEFVWRHLHPEIQVATRRYYENQDYYLAVNEAIKRYVTLAKVRSGTTASEAAQIMGNAFGDAGLLAVFKPYMDSTGFDSQTEKNVENGQRHMSMGMVAGFRNPLAHEEISRLQDSGAFTNDDCLDALSILSHLMRRLDAAVVKGVPPAM